MAKNEVSNVNMNETMPAFLQEKMQDNRGSEEVGSDDLVIPRIELVQSLSACRKKTDPAYIDGAQEGMLYNNVTRELYGESINVVPVFFRKEYLLWRDTKLGGGFGGAFPDGASAEEARQTQEVPDEWEVVDTNQHFVLVLKEDGSVEEAVMSMAKTKSRVSRNWNSLVRINGGPRFSRVYEISGVADQNKAGQDFYNLSVKNVGFGTEQVFKHAEQIYDMVKSGGAAVDRSTEVTEDDSEM
jgi:hypothetical protein